MNLRKAKKLYARPITFWSAGGFSAADHRRNWRDMRSGQIANRYSAKMNRFASINQMLRWRHRYWELVEDRNRQ